MDELFEASSSVLDAITDILGALGPTGSFFMVGLGTVALVWMVGRAMRV